MAATRRQELKGLGRVTGQLVEWKGKFGWIQPSGPINHPQAAKRGGKVYLSHVDVEEDISGVGAYISFSLYMDGTGLGASAVRPDDGDASSVAHTIEKKPMPGNQGSGFAGARPSQKGAGKGAADAAGAFLAKPTIELKVGTRARIINNKDSPEFNGMECKLEEWDALTNCWHCELLKSGDFKGFKVENLMGLPEKPEPDLPPPSFALPQKTAAPTPATGGGPKRNRITEEPITGEVVEWRGMFGWITPSEPIDHPDAKKRQGRIYVSKKDLSDGSTQLEKGQTVQFHAYSDGNGLGAEEVESA